jgi:N-acetylneuraminate synthase
MAGMTLRDSRVVSEAHAPYVVAEVNTSHFGDLQNARDMILAAKKAGCDCVKFQSWTEHTLYSKTFYRENPIASRFVRKFSFSEAQLLEAAEFCRQQGIAFSSTPYSRPEVDFLVGSGAPFIKIASMELNNYEYLAYIARTGVPIVLSTGMGEMEEIRRAVKTIEDAGCKNLCILHCVSIYPPKTASLRLRNITGLRQEFPRHAIGFSDHSLGTEMATAAVALGAVLIEKHLTLDRTKIGMDNQMATEPEEMAQLVRHCHNVHTALGGVERVVFPEDVEQRKKLRRSVVTTKDLKAGTRLSREDLEVKRPGTGILPEKLGEVVGRVLARDVAADEVLSPEDLQ